MLWEEGPQMVQRYLLLRSLRHKETDCCLHLPNLNGPIEILRAQQQNASTCGNGAVKLQLAETARCGCAHAGAS
jgi:hypothetical protein